MSETMMNGPSHSDATPAPPPLAQAVSLHLEGRRREALEVIEGALASGGNSPELFSADALTSLNATASKGRARPAGATTSSAANRR